MITFNVKKITKKLKTKFRSPDRPASHFINKKLWSDCQGMFNDRICTEKIIFANSLGVPPVKAIIRILIDDYNYPSDTVFTAQEARNLGSLINYVFKDLLGFNSVHPRRTVKLCGVKEGCIFTKSDMGIPKQPFITDYQTDNVQNIPTIDKDMQNQTVSPINDNKLDFSGW